MNKQDWKKVLLSPLVVILLTVLNTTNAQNSNESVGWKQVLKQPSEWYSGKEAIRIADNVLIYQHKTGGWPKNIDMVSELSSADVEDILKKKESPKQHIGQPTMDNKATSTQLRFLAKVYEQTKEKRYYESIAKGINYLLDAQYDNGGWPQFYPIKKGYYEHITYNDNAMMNTMVFLRNILKGEKEFAAIEVSDKQKEQIKVAFDKGIKCILNTQIVVDGELTVWCAQHDKNTLKPAKARAYELPSFSGAESVNIVKLLMEIKNPSEEVIQSVKGAVKWFEEHKITGVRVDRITTDGKKDKLVIADENAPAIWARFYDLETAEPFFCDRDGIKKKTLAEIGIERRGGYSWYTKSPKKIIDKYPKWSKKWNVD